MQLIFSLGGLIVWYVGGRDVLAGTMTLGSLMAFLAYLAMFYTPLATLSQFTTWLTNFLTGCQRVFELLDTPVESTDPASPVDLPQGRGRASASRTSRSATSGTSRCCANVNFAIEPGETIGIVGRSGSGKTTLVNLLCRFYDVNEGRVLVDGVDVRQARRAAAAASTSASCCRSRSCSAARSGTTSSTACPTSTPEQAIAAAKAAQAHDFILHSPLGYDTWLGERGAGLSGGERQRLSIARAILYDPPILILDEATSNVDTESEQAIQQAPRRLTRGRTTIAIAHRLSTLRDADRILVFDRGRLIEQGSHDELIAADGQYAKLVRLQSRRDDATRRSTPTLKMAAPGQSSRSAILSPRWLTPCRRHNSCAAARGTIEIATRRRSHAPRRLRREPVPRHEPRRLHQPPRLEPRRRRAGNRHPPRTRTLAGRGPVAGPRRPSSRRYWLQPITGVDQIETRTRPPARSTSARPTARGDSRCAGARARCKTSATAARSCSTSTTTASWCPTSRPSRPRAGSVPAVRVLVTAPPRPFPRRSPPVAIA